jgi:hypothetical protein
VRDGDICGQDRQTLLARPWQSRDLALTICAGVLLLALANCGSDRFDEVLCGGRPIVAPSLVISDGTLSRLSMFSLTVGHAPKAPDYNIWSDEGGDYGRSLTYRYEKDDPCPIMAVLRLRYELDEIDQQMGLEYIGKLESSGDLGQIRSAFQRLVDEPVFYTPHIVQDSTKVVQVMAHHHATRGDFVEISISDPGWYKTNWQK